MLQDVAASVGRTIGKVKSMPHVLLSVGGAVVPLLRELRETEYQFTAPYVLDSSDIEETLRPGSDPVGRGLPGDGRERAAGSEPGPGASAPSPP